MTMIVIIIKLLHNHFVFVALFPDFFVESSTRDSEARLEFSSRPKKISF